MYIVHVSKLSIAKYRRMKRRYRCRYSGRLHERILVCWLKGNEVGGGIRIRRGESVVIVGYRGAEGWPPTKFRYSFREPTSKLKCVKRSINFIKLYKIIAYVRVRSHDISMRPKRSLDTSTSLVHIRTIPTYVAKYGTYECMYVCMRAWLRTRKGAQGDRERQILLGTYM